MRIFLSLFLVGLLCHPVFADLFSEAGPGTFDDQNPLISEVNFSEAEVIFDLEIRVNGLTYDWAGDLVLTLTSPDGTTADLVRRLGQTSPNSTTDSGSSSNFDGDYLFTDSGTDIWDAAVDPSDPADPDFVIASGDYYASTASTTSPSVQVGIADAFAGESTLGNWTLVIEDFDPDSVGSISSWSITTVSTAVPEPSSLLGLMCGGLMLVRVRVR